jgi:hypothetical protein
MEWWVYKDVVRGLFQGTIPAVTFSDWENQEIFSQDNR